MTTSSTLGKLAAGSAVLVALSVGTALPALADTTDLPPDSSHAAVTAVADDPGETDPGETDPGETDPGETDPGETDPGETDPGETDPGTTEPGTTEPGTTDPGTVAPDPGAQPSTSTPATPVSNKRPPRKSPVGPMLAETGADEKAVLAGGLIGGGLLFGGLATVFASRLEKRPVESPRRTNA